MPLIKSTGNMYSWVTDMHTHLGGDCPHACSYCYVNTGFMNTPRPKRYCGPLRLIEQEFKVNYGTGKTIFIEHKNDLFCAEMPDVFIIRIIAHCLKHPGNTYVFQTKNPVRYLSWDALFPKGSILGTTIETNRDMSKISKAQPAGERALAMCRLPKEIRKFVTIEPVLDFDVDILAGWIADIRPEFLNLGADSKGHNLPEPSIDKIYAFAEKLKEYGIELREKHNLARLMEKS
jgi:DNA repair photolyase